MNNTIKANNNLSDSKADTFQYFVEKFADIKILRYQVFGFDTLSLKQKELIYYLSKAANCGRDILFDQNGKFNLTIRQTLENIYLTYTGNRNTPEFSEFTIYLKRVWFSNGIYHHYSTEKFLPSFSKQYFAQLINQSDKTKFPISNNEPLSVFITRIEPIMFDPTVLPKRVWQDPSKDLITNSACNYYEGVTENEVVEFYKAKKDLNNPTPLSVGLNTKLVKENGKLVEKVWFVKGMYGKAIEQIVFWLQKAVTVAENNKQQQVIEKLIAYYKTGNLQTWDEYNIAWVEDLHSHIDFVNGFIEVYGDPMGIKGSWESIVNFKNIEATERTLKLSNNAQWFEDNSPVDARFKKDTVKGVSAKVITVAQLGGDCYPATPIGINLPNADWIRRDHGSKSVTIENITYAYDQAAQKTGMLEEFATNQWEIDIIRKYSFIAGNLHTDLHECLGHGSGKMLPGVTSEMLKNYHSTLEETRADLFALYYMMDNKMLELGLLPSLDAAKAEYITYMRNGLMTQLVRIEPGKNLEESHMRNRQLIAKWCFEMGKPQNVIEFVKQNNKTYLRINDFNKLHQLIGTLLAQVQRIKSEGDYEAGKKLVEQYGVIIDPTLHTEVLERYKKLNLAPYSGFINPMYKAIEQNGVITNIEVEYPSDFAQQMLYYSSHFSFLE